MFCLENTVYSRSVKMDTLWGQGEDLSGLAQRRFFSLSCCLSNKALDHPDSMTQNDEQPLSRSVLGALAKGKKAPEASYQELNALA